MSVSPSFGVSRFRFFWILGFTESRRPDGCPLPLSGGPGCRAVDIGAASHGLQAGDRAPIAACPRSPWIYSGIYCTFWVLTCCRKSINENLLSPSSTCSPSPSPPSTQVYLVGDPVQLPATVISRRAIEYNYDNSLFKRLQLAGYPVKVSIYIPFCLPASPSRPLSTFLLLYRSWTLNIACIQASANSHRRTFTEASCSMEG